MEGVVRNHVAKDRDKVRTIMYTLMNLWVPWSAGNYYIVKKDSVLWAWFRIRQSWAVRIMTFLARIDQAVSGPTLEHI